jgi:hypothetical protein
MNSDHGCVIYIATKNIQSQSIRPGPPLHTIYVPELEHLQTRGCDVKAVTPAPLYNYFMRPLSPYIHPSSSNASRYLPSQSSFFSDTFQLFTPYHHLRTLAPIVFPCILAFRFQWLQPQRIKFHATPCINGNRTYNHKQDSVSPPELPILPICPRSGEKREKEPKHT